MSKIAITPNASGTGTINIVAPNTNTDRTLTIPDITGNVVTTGDSGSVTGTMIGSLPAGSVIQVVQSVITNHNSSASASWVASNVFGSITPTYNTSKILVQFTGVIRSYNTSGADARTAWRIYKDVGGGGFNQLGTHQMTHRIYDYGASGSINDIPMHMQYLDSPSTTSTLTYKLYLYKEQGTAGEWNPDGDDESYVTLMEIAQ
jgi:hypothetical protein